MAHESKLERNFTVLAEFLPTVRIFEEQPVALPYRATSGRSAIYHPDYLVEFEEPDRPALLAEIKPIASLKRNSLRFSAKFAAASEFARDRGWQFRIVTDRVLNHPIVDSALFLLPFRAVRLGSQELEAVVTALHQLGGLASAKAALDRLDEMGFQRAMATSWVWSAVSAFKIGCQWDKPLSMSSMLSAHPDVLPLPRIRSLS